MNLSVGYITEENLEPISNRTIILKISASIIKAPINIQIKGLSKQEILNYRVLREKKSKGVAATADFGKIIFYDSRK